MVLLVFICLPAIGTYFFPSAALECAKDRELAEKPEWRLCSLEKYPGAFEKYFDDHFGFRRSLIRWNSFAKVKWFGISPLASVVLGRDSWMFYRSDAVGDGISFDDYKGIRPLSPEGLERIRRNIERDRRKMAALGIVYILAIAPNKQTIYEEYLPKNIRRVHPLTRFDQLMDYLHAHSSIEIIDLRKALKEAKHLHPVYYKTDTHWNDYGAYVAYLQIMKHLSNHFPFLKPISIPDSGISIHGTSTGGDLPDMMAIRDLIPEAYEAQLALPPDTGAPHAGTLFMRHDSFGDKLYRFFYRHFDKVVGLPPFTRFDFRKMEAERPSVVINIMAERYINMTLNDDYFFSEK